MTSPSMPTRMPYDLHANDIVRHIINVDSRHRDTPQFSTASDFYFTLLDTIRNVLRIRITSIEFPNNYFFFTQKRRNTFLTFKYRDDDGRGAEHTTTVQIPEGNYTVEQMIVELSDRMTMAGLPFLPETGPILDFSTVNGAFTFYGKYEFTVDTATGTYPRPFDYGLGYYMGFTRGEFASDLDASGSFYVMSNICANFAGDSYVFLRVNDFNNVRQTVRIYNDKGVVEPTEFSALAKIILREPKNFMTYDDYASHHIKEYVFPSPGTLSRLRVEILDSYGNVIDLCSSQVSFSLEITEVRNSTLCNAIRDSMAVQYL